eukprot:182705-Chlamydomonas_euryale.AAC.12
MALPSRLSATASPTPPRSDAPVGESLDNNTVETVKGVLRLNLAEVRWQRAWRRRVPALVPSTSHRRCVCQCRLICCEHDRRCLPAAILLRVLPTRRGAGTRTLVRFSIERERIDCTCCQRLSGAARIGGGVLRRITSCIPRPCEHVAIALTCSPPPHLRSVRPSPQLKVALQKLAGVSSTASIGLHQSAEILAKHLAVSLCRCASA